MRRKTYIRLRGYVSTDEAAETLGVARKTVIAWVRSGWLKGRLVRGKSLRIWVASESLGAAFLATCVVCGKRFRAKHPQKAKFCSLRHKNIFFHCKRNRHKAKMPHH